MTTNDTLREIQSLVNKQSEQLAVSLPASAVEFLLNQSAALAVAKEEKRKLQDKYNYYRDCYQSTKAEACVLRKELDRLRKVYE